MKYLIIFLIALPDMLRAQNVGIGTSAPVAGLHVVSNNGLVLRGMHNTGAVLNESAPGSLFIFNPRKGGALRAGFLSQGGQAYWNYESTGIYSIGLGFDARATGESSIAIGQLTAATGTNATAIGYGCIAEMPNSIALSAVSCSAKAQFAVAIGSYVNANTYGSMAFGRNINAGYPFQGYGQNTFAIGLGDVLDFSTGGHFATGNRAFAIGNNCRSVGSRAFAIGNDCAAGQFFENDQSGRYSFAMGNSCVASGIFSFALGNNANTNGRQGAMVLASRLDGVTVPSPADFHFLAQFAGGYQLQSNNAGTLGVYLNPNASSWASLCDSTKKEDVLAMNDEQMLEKLAAINYTSWKYKDDPDATNRHYGIMAQDFYAAFGKDGLGKIGNDSLVNPIDLLGVAYSAIKALEKRTAEIAGLKVENEELKTRLEKLESLVTAQVRKN